MMTTLLIVAAVLAAIFFVEIIAVAKAPEGFQDETGFHFGSEERPAVVRESASLPQGVGCLNPT